MIEDPDNIFKEYDPSNPVHNPAGYIAARAEVDRDIKRQAHLAMKERLTDKPFHFAKLSVVYWLLIISLCFFVGYLLAVV